MAVVESFCSKAYSQVGFIQIEMKFTAYVISWHLPGKADLDQLFVIDFYRNKTNKTTMNEYEYNNM